MTNLFFLRSARLMLVILLGCGLTISPALQETAYSLKGNIIYVDADAEGMGTGKDWQNAFIHLQDGLSAAASGDTIFVAQGTYCPDRDASNPKGTGLRMASFALINHVRIYGGFDPSQGAGTFLERNWKKYRTYLSGDIGLRGNNSDNSYHVVRNSKEIDNTAVLDGFIITEGNANGSGDQLNSGGGIYNENASPQIRYCLFYKNEAESRGAGMYNIYEAAPVVSNCYFENNIAGETGGGVYNSSSGPEFEACSFIDNQATSGAAMYNRDSDPLIVSSTFIGNEAGYGGGAIYNYDSSYPELYNCVFNENSAPYGAAIHNADYSAPLVINSTFYENSAASHGFGGAVFNRPDSSATMVNSILWHDNPDEIYPTASCDVSYSNVDGTGVYPGVGNINVAPVLDASFHLGSDSPCIDKGQNGAVPAWLSTDFEGDPRIVNGDFNDPEARVDIGADEAPLVTITHELSIDSSAGGSVTIPGEGIFTYNHGTVVDLRATPRQSFRFLNWSGDTGQLADVRSPQTVITMRGDYRITANFEIDADPDLIVTDVWNDDDAICFQVRNIGEAVAPKGHHVRLYIDNEPVASDLIDYELIPGERLSSCFSKYTWSCTTFADDIQLCADGNKVVKESDEKNNCRTEAWQCDTIPPVITSQPVIAQVGPHTVDISWNTDTLSDSVVMYSTTAGLLNRHTEDLKPTQTHLIQLDNLAASSTYHFCVRSTDASGNTVESRDFFFQTAAAPDSSAPVISDLKIKRGAGNLLYYMMAAQVEDNTGVERVEFYMDDKLICIDYSGPFNCQLAPMHMGMSQADFFREHTVQALAFDHAGLVAGFDSRFEPAYECADIWLEMEDPYPNEVFFIDTATVPAGTSIPIRVTASMPELNCTYVDLSGLPPGANQFFCEEEQNPVSEVRFYFNRQLIATEYPLTPLDFIFDVDYDISGKYPGTYSIRVDAIADDECKQTITNTIHIEIGEPELNVTREVTRIGNYFRIDLVIRNQGTGTATFDKVQDSVDGFQPIASSETDYDVLSQCANDGKHCDVEIDFADNPYALAAQRSKRISYFAVPIVYPPAEAAEYRIGPNPVRILDLAGTDIQEFERPCVLTEDEYTLASEVNRALRGSDYLIITNPDSLFSFSADVAGVNRLLAAMAELARYRNGIIGYLFGPDSDDTGWIKECIRTWGTPMMGLDGVSERYLSNGYLLLVGEIEIIPSFSKTVEDEWWFITIATYHVNWTDMPYGDTNGHIDPELSVARIIGDDPAELILPLEASINVVKAEPGFEFDRSHAFVISGRGDGVDSFEQNVDDVEEILDDEFVVTNRKQRVVENSGSDMNAEFKNLDANQDHFYYRDHCSPFGWSGVIGTADFGGFNPVDFEDAKPFVFSCCCQAGQYEDDPEDAADSSNIAESFLQHGAASYIGATENSFRGQNNSAAVWFYNHWVNTPNPVGEIFRTLKVHLGGYQGDIWSYEYNLYGDPKFGGTEPLLTAAAPKEISVPPSPYVLEVPDYEVKSLNGEDHVKIPEGNMLLVEEKPAVPYYKVKIEYPSGYCVQDVTLINRSGLETASGLNIPHSDMGLDVAGKKGAAVSQDAEEWWPPLEAIFDYHFETRSSGNSLLTITLFPFYYNSLTTDVRFYKNYAFDIQSTASGSGIVLLTTGKDHYAPGETVQVDLTLSSSEAPQEVIVEVVVKKESSNEIVDGLLLHTLRGMTKTSIFSANWDTSNFPPGSYFLEANIRDGAGNLLDQRRKPINLGVTSLEIESFTVTADASDLNSSLVFKNNGGVGLSGTAIIKVQNPQGHSIQEIKHDFADLQPLNSLNFQDSWDASGAAKGVYLIQAYVLYDSRSSEIRSVTIPICLELSDIAKVFGCVIGDSRYDYSLDFNRDGDVDGMELAVFRTYQGLAICP